MVNQENVKELLFKLNEEVNKINCREDQKEAKEHLEELKEILQLH